MDNKTQILDTVLERYISKMVEELEPEYKFQIQQAMQQSFSLLGLNDLSQEQLARFVDSALRSIALSKITIIAGLN